MPDGTKSWTVVRDWSSVEPVDQFLGPDPDTWALGGPWRAAAAGLPPGRSAPPSSSTKFFLGVSHLAGCVCCARYSALTGRRAREEGPARSNPGATVIG